MTPRPTGARVRVARMTVVSKEKQKQKYLSLQMPFL